MIKKGGEISLQLPYMREQGTTNVGCKKRHISSLNQRYKIAFFSYQYLPQTHHFYIYSAFSYTLCLLLSVKSQRLEINSMIALEKGNCCLYLRFLCQVALLKA